MSADLIHVPRARASAAREHRPRFGMPKVLPARTDLAPAVAKLADDLLTGAFCTSEIAARALDRLRRSVHAAHAVVWLIDGGRVERALHAGQENKPSDGVLDLDREHAILMRLRHNVTVLCRCGDVSGLEALVPAGTGSFVAAITRSDRINGVLVIGWTGPTPPCDETAAVHFRTAATLILNAITPIAHSKGQENVPEAILDSIAERIAIVDRRGIILAVNRAWTEFGQSQGWPPSTVAPGVSYADVCRRAAASVGDVAETLAGIEAVYTGTAPSFETTNAFETSGGEQPCLVMATPLRGAEGGAVVVHVNVTSSKLTGMARRMSERFFHRLADTVSLPILIVAPDGRILYGNRRWVDTGDQGAPAIGATWTNGFHPDDRARAAAEFESAVERRARFALELRVKASDESYRWCVCIAEPQCSADGRLESHVAVCCDISAQHRAESELSAVAAKLIGAQEAENSRIARELHDDLGQQVAVVIAELSALACTRPASASRMRVELTKTRKRLQEVATSVHTLSHTLHPAKLKLLGLKETVQALCRDVARGGAVLVDFAAQSLSPNVGESTALCVFRVAQEALQNAVKHSQARKIEVSLTGTPSQLTLRVCDDGTGFDPLSPRAAGIGLMTMRERVELSGGSLRVETAHARGTTIEATVPTESGQRRPDASA
jgi:PAS domain S-box-containing protein